MPLTRYQIRNEFSLADPELYRAADKNDPEALLEGVAMAGLVGLLRQLGDLAEFAAELFHDLHEQVVATSARGHGLMNRLHQIEADIPSIEKACLSRTDHLQILRNAGIDWHSNFRMDQNLVTRGDLPRFVMDSYEECRGPPRLFLLDKFDIAGAGACLKRYSDPSFFKTEFSSSETANTESQREKRARKIKKKASRLANGETPDVVKTSNFKLHQLLSEERSQTEKSVPIHHVKLKRRQSSCSLLDSTTGESYMKRFLSTNSPQRKALYESSRSPLRLTMGSSNSDELVSDIHEVSTRSPDNVLQKSYRSPPQLPVGQETALKQSFDEKILDIKLENIPDGKTEANNDGYRSEDVTSEMDSFVDALTTMESDMDTDAENRLRAERGLFNIEKKGKGSDRNEERHDIHTLSTDIEVPYATSNEHSHENCLSKFREPSCDSSFTSSRPASTHISSGESLTEFQLVAPSFVAVSTGSEGERSSGSDLPCQTKISDTPSALRSDLLPLEFQKTQLVEMLDGGNLKKDKPDCFTGEGVEASSTIRPLECLPDGIVAEMEDVLSTGEEPECLALMDNHPEPKDFTEHQNINMTDAVLDNDLTTVIVDSTACSEEKTVCSNLRGFSGTLVCDEEEQPVPDMVHLTSFSSKDDDKSAAHDLLPSYAKADTRASSSEVETSYDNLEVMSNTPACAVEDGPAPKRDPVNSRGNMGNSDVPLDVELRHAKSDSQESSSEIRTSYSNLEGLSRTASFDVEDGVLIDKDHLDSLGTEDKSDIPPDLVSNCSSSDSQKSSSVTEVHSQLADSGLIIASSEAEDEQKITKESSSGFQYELNIKEVSIQRHSNELDAKHESTLGPSDSHVQLCVAKSLKQGFNSPSSLWESNHKSVAKQPPLVYYSKSSGKPEPLDAHSLSELEDPIEDRVEVKTDQNSLASSHEDEGFPDHINDDERKASSMSCSTDALLQPSELRFSLFPTNHQKTLDSSPNTQAIDSSQPDHSATQAIVERPSHTSAVLLQGTVEKLQHDSFMSEGELVQPNFNLPSQLSPATIDKDQHSFPPIEEELADPRNPVLPQQTTDAEKPREGCSMLDGKLVQPHSNPYSSLPACEDASIQQDSQTLDRKPVLLVNPFLPLPATEHELRQCGLIVGEDGKPHVSFSQSTCTEDGRHEHCDLTSERELLWSSSFAVPNVEDGTPNEVLPKKIPRPRNPLIEEFASKDKSTLRKVETRAWPDLMQKMDARNSLLEQIRAKSFNLKPAVATRPSIKGPNTNLKVVAILEKANAIRQALAGSDDDDDDDSWSDS